MDVRFFLKLRIDFVRQLNIAASRPYLERKRKIEAEEEPFIPPYAEDGEPAFLEEWVEAEDSLHVLAYSCLSMLSAALHLYLETWVRLSGVSVEESLKKSFKKDGWFAGYRAHFFQRLEIDFAEAPVNLRLLEEMVLARNRIEHPSSITNSRAQYSASDIKKLRHPFFINEWETAAFAETEEGEKPWLLPPTLHVTEEQLFTAISEVECFAEWFEMAIENRVYGRHSTSE